jgi:DNA-binding NarL/FixJ family response regulator
MMPVSEPPRRAPAHHAEIARELFLSKKTVETHIRNMFRKLDANSRVDIARAMEAAERRVP